MSNIVGEFDTAIPDLVAEAIGDSSLAPKVRDVIEVSRKRLIVFHGIKKENRIAQVAEKGILPLTPEGRNGGASFWTAHKRIFMSFVDARGIQTFDTSFFHYGHSQTDDKGYSVMALALTSPDRLQGTPAKITEDDFKRGYVQIHNTVPPDALDLLVVNRDTDTTRSSRENGQAIEADMLELVHKKLTEDL